MLESNLSIIASALTILGFFITIFIKQHSINNNQKIKGDNNSINNDQSITINENNTFNDVKNLMNSQNNENEMVILGFQIIAILVSITLFIKLNHLIITISCLLTLLTSFLIWIKLVKYHLSIRAFWFYTIKYILISSILISGLFINPVLVSNLERILPAIDNSNSMPFITSIITMSKSTFMYLKNLGFPSYDSFVIVFRFLSIIFIYFILYHDIKKNSFLKATTHLYKKGNNLLLSYAYLTLKLCFILYLMHFQHFQNPTKNILNPILDWFNIPHK